MSLSLTKDQRCALPKAPGVYRLIADGVVVYVGASISVRSRVGSHNLRGLFNDVSYLMAPLAELCRLEREWIAKYKPTLNKRSAYYFYYPKEKEALLPREPQAVCKKPYVHGTPGRSYLVHRVGELSVQRDWKAKNAMSATVHAKCGLMIFLGPRRKGRLSDVVPSGAYLCGRCDGGKSHFPYKDPNAVQSRAHARFALAITSSEAAA